MIEQKSNNFKKKKINKLKFYFSIIKTYKKKLIQILFFEIINVIKFGDTFYKIHNSDVQTDSLPCPYYFLRKISKFINKNSISEVIDLGSGTGRIVNYLAVSTKANVTGYEIDHEILEYSKSKNIKNANFFEKDINLLDFSLLDSNCYIFNIPLQKEQDIKKLIDKIQFDRNKIKKKYFLIIINIDSHLVNIKLNDIFKNYKLINFIQAGDTKTLRIYENKF